MLRYSRCDCASLQERYREAAGLTGTCMGPPKLLVAVSIIWCTLLGSLKPQHDAAPFGLGSTVHLLRALAVRQSQGSGAHRNCVICLIHIVRLIEAQHNATPAGLGCVEVSRGSIACCVYHGHILRSARQHSTLHKRGCQIRCLFQYTTRSCPSCIQQRGRPAMHTSLQPADLRHMQACLATMHPMLPTHPHSWLGRTRDSAVRGSSLHRMWRTLPGGCETGAYRSVVVPPVVGPRQARAGQRSVDFAEVHHARALLRVERSGWGS